MGKYNGRGRNRGNGGSSSALDSAVLDPRPEDRVREECVDILKKIGFGVWRIENDKEVEDGMADTIIKHPAHRESVMLEFKRPTILKADSGILDEYQAGGKQRPSQVKFQKDWEDKGGIYWLVASVSDLRSYLQQYGVIEP